jgi:hypothetical protein
MSLAPGVRLGAYEVLSLIGMGGMGLVALTRGIGALAECKIDRLQWH